MTTNPTEIKWDIKSLETTFSMEFIKLCFPEELSFIIRNNWRFLQNKPTILTALNANGLSVSALLEVRRLLNTEIENERLAKEAAERDAAEEAETARKKSIYRGETLPDPRSLTAAGAPWRNQ